MSVPIILNTSSRASYLCSHTKRYFIVDTISMRKRGRRKMELEREERRKVLFPMCVFMRTVIFTVQLFVPKRIPERVP